MRKLPEPFLCETFGAAKVGDGVTALDDGERGERKLQSNTAYGYHWCKQAICFFMSYFSHDLSRTSSQHASCEF
jgi:hypothetical protein